MKRAEAKTVVALLSAAFPREPMPDSTVQVWAAALEPLEFADAQVAVQDLALLLDRMPSLRQIATATERARIDRLADVPVLEQAGGVSFGEWLKTLPDEERNRALRVFAGLRQQLDIEVDV